MDCPRCGTKMQGGVCPECGFPVLQAFPKAKSALGARRKPIALLKPEDLH